VKEGGGEEELRSCEEVRICEEELRRRGSERIREQLRICEEW